MFLYINFSRYIYFFITIIYRIICALATVSDFKNTVKPQLWTWNFQLNEHLVISKVDGFYNVHLCWADVFMDLLFLLYAFESTSAIQHVEIFLR